MMILKVDHYDEPQKLNCKINFTQLNTKAICCIPTVLKSKLNPEADIFRSQKAKTHDFILNISTPAFYPVYSLTNMEDMQPEYPVVQNRDIEHEASAYSLLQNLRIKNWNRIIVGHLNINSEKNKIHELADLVTGKIDFLLISESKIDNTFPTTQFVISGFSTPYRLDRSIQDGGLFLYIKNRIPSKLLKCLYCEEIECLTMEFTIGKSN